MRRIVVLFLVLVSSVARAELDPERLTLGAAVARALRRNPTAAVALAEVRRAQALIEQVRAAALPNLSVTATYTRLDDDRRFNERVVSAANQLSGVANLTVPLVAPQRWVQWSHARDGRRIAELGAVDVRRQVAAAVARAYLTLLTLRRNIEILERARDTARAHLQFSHARRVGGVGNRLDEVRAGQELSTDEAQVQAAYGQQARAREALAVLVGAEGPVDCADEAPLPPPPPEPEALDEAQRRSDVEAQRARLWAAQRQVRDSWADYMPLLLGVFQPGGLLAVDTNGNLVSPPSLAQPALSWQAQLILSVPIYEGGLRYGQRHERLALSAQAQATLEGALRQARSDVRAAFAALRKADEGLLAAREAARLAAEALGLANLAYRAGATTNLEVIDAERRARDAATAAETAEDTARQARLDLLIASGRFP